MTIEVESTQVAEIFEKDVNKLCEDINVVIEAHNKLVDENAELKNIIKKVREYIMSELITEWDIENGGHVSGSDLPVEAITPILQILDKER